MITPKEMKKIANSTGFSYPTKEIADSNNPFKRTMKIVPVEDRILIEAHPADAEESGFFEASKASERPKKGTVIAVGPGRYLLDEGKFILTPMPVKVGDTIFFGRNVGTEMVVDGHVFLIMRLGEAYAIM